MSLQGAKDSSEEIQVVGDTLELPDDLENPEFEIPQTQRELASQDVGEKSASQHLSENDDVEDEDEEEENEAEQSASHSGSESPAESSDEEDEAVEVAVETKVTPAAEINLLAPTVVEEAPVSAPEESKPVVEAKEEVVPEETTPRGKVAPVVDAQVEEKAEATHDEPATPRGKVAPKIAAMIKALEGKIAESAVKSEDVSLLGGNVKALVTHYNNVRSNKDVRNLEEQPAAVATASIAAETDKSAARLSK